MHLSCVSFRSLNSSAQVVELHESDSTELDVLELRRALNYSLPPHNTLNLKKKKKKYTTNQPKCRDMQKKNQCSQQSKRLVIAAGKGSTKVIC